MQKKMRTTKIMTINKKIKRDKMIKKKIKNDKMIKNIAMKKCKSIQYTGCTKKHSFVISKF